MFSEIFEYIKKCRKLNIGDSTIFSVLKNSGWKEADINYAFTEYNKIDLLPPTPIPNYDAPTHVINPEPALSQPVKSVPKAFYNQPIYVIDKEKGVVVRNSTPVVKKGFKARLVGLFKRKQKAKVVPEVVSQVVPVVGNVKKTSKLKRNLRKAEKIFTIVIGLSLIGLIVWWVVSLNNKSGGIDAAADTERLAQVNLIQEGVVKYYRKSYKLPTALKDIDSKSEFTIDSGTNQPFDYKVLTPTSFQTCTVFYTNGESYDKGYVCFPFEVDKTGGVVAGLAFNPQIQQPLQTNKESAIPFYFCTNNPKPLLTANARCTEVSGNCRKPIINQEFGISSIGLSNSKDKIAQTFVLPKLAKELTEVAPFVFDFFGNMGCMSIYEQTMATQSQSGKLLAEYQVDITKLKKDEYNSLFIDPITLDPTKSYSIVFSLLDNDSFISFAKGNELSSYYDGHAYYLKRPLVECTGKDCPVVEWIDRQDDIKFKLKFF